MILIHLFLQRLQCFWVHIPVKFLKSKDKGYLEFTVANQSAPATLSTDLGM